MNFSLRGWSLLIVTSAFWVIPAFAVLEELPNRETPRPVTTDGIPHIQIDVEPVPEISDELLRRVSLIAGVELHDTIVGRSGSSGFWLSERIKMARPESIIRGREFAHCHPDGSLHASLPPDLAAKAVELGWATPHPWAAKKSGLEGFVMIYTPTTRDELAVVLQLVMESYKYVSGKDAASTEI